MFSLCSNHCGWPVACPWVRVHGGRGSGYARPWMPWHWDSSCRPWEIFEVLTWLYGVLGQWQQNRRKRHLRPGGQLGSSFRGLCREAYGLNKSHVHLVSASHGCCLSGYSALSDGKDFSETWSSSQWSSVEESSLCLENKIPSHPRIIYLKSKAPLAFHVRDTLQEISVLSITIIISFGLWGSRKIINFF